MKKSIIDIGSNSVRLAIFDDELVLLRQKITSRLAEKKVDGNLSSDAIVRTFCALKKIIEISITNGVDEKNIYAFATAGVRNSKNGNEFTELADTILYNKLDVISGELEGELAFLGALGKKDGAVLDIGGASTELSIAMNGKLIYSKSLPIGAVILHDMCGENKEYLQKVIDDEIVSLNAPEFDCLKAVGGTATACALIDIAPLSYERSRIHNHFVSAKNLEKALDKLFELSVQERIEQFGIENRRAEIILGGVLLLLSIIKRFKLSGVTVSEDDNLEGYHRFLEDKGNEN